MFIIISISEVNIYEL